MKKRNLLQAFACIVITVAVIGLMTGCPQPEEEDRQRLEERTDQCVYRRCERGQLR